MPKTPPLIIPNSIPNDWINRSKISKSNTKVKNIFAPQNKKQLRFEDTEELQFADNYQPSSEIGLNDFLQQNEHQDASSPQVAASDIFYFTSLNQQNNLSQSSFKHSQQDQNNNKNMSQQRYMKTDTVVEEQDKQQKLNIIEQASQKDQMILQTNENFNSTLTGIYILTIVILPLTAIIF